MMNKTSMKMFLRKGFYFLMFLSFAVLVLQSCYPYDELTPEETDIVATFYDDATNFANLVTYSMPDTVFEIDSNGDIVVADISSTNEQAILNAIRTNMDEMGFTEETVTPASANVFIASFVASSTWVSGGCYGGYYSWYYPYYSWCYPVAYTYTTGSILIVMSVPDNTNPISVWIAGINGLLEDYNANVTSRINENINQAFVQSPYLGEGK
jgi:hypothetical protein